MIPKPLDQAKQFLSLKNSNILMSFRDYLTLPSLQIKSDKNFTFSN